MKWFQSIAIVFVALCLAAGCGGGEQESNKSTADSGEKPTAPPGRANAQNTKNTKNTKKIRKPNTAKGSKKAEQSKTLTDSKGGSEISKAISALEKLGIEFKIHESDRGGPYAAKANNKDFNDENMKLFAKFTTLGRIDLSDTKVTGKGFVHVKGADLLKITLNRTALTDEGLKYLKDFPRLDVLYIEHTKITDDGLEHLMGLPVGQIHLRGCDVTSDGVKRLRESLTKPTAWIRYEK